MLNTDQRNNDLIKESVSELVREILCEETDKGKIAILLSVFSKFEGASRVAEQQAKELSRNGYSVVVLTFVSDIIPENFEIDIIKPIIPLNNPFLNRIYHGLFPFNVIKTMMLVRKLKGFDLIILHHGTLANLAYLAKKFYGTKVIFCNHHVEGEEPRFSFSIVDLVERIYNKLVWHIHWGIIKKFDYVISVSKYSRAKLRVRIGVDSIVIYDKIDDERFKEGLDKKIVRDKYRIGGDPLILFVGRILPYKNIHSLIDAFKIVEEKVPNVRLIIVGKHYNKVYSEKLMKMGGESIFFAERVSDEALPFYYAACDVYATCSLLEGFNLPLSEAQACGTPVVAFNIGPHKEVVKNGFLVKEGDIEEFSAKLIEILKRCDGVSGNE